MATTLALVARRSERVRLNSFAGTTALAIVWAFFMVPETAGRSAIDIDALYHAGIPPRKFADIDVETLKRSQSEEDSGHAPVV